MAGHLLRLHLLCVLLLTGCGGAPATRPATHDDFRAVQRAEAVVAESTTQVVRGEGPCEPSCAAQAQIVDAVGAICGLARDTADLDLEARCRAARDQQIAADGELAARGCGCEALDRP